MSPKSSPFAAGAAMDTANPPPRKTNGKQAKEIPATPSPKRGTAPRYSGRGKSRSPSRSSETFPDASPSDQMRAVLDALRSAQRGEFSVLMHSDTGLGVVESVAVEAHRVAKGVGT